MDKKVTKARILRGFSKKRVDYTGAIKDFYIEDGLAYISCNVNSYDEVIDHYSVKGYEWPNRDFLQFVEDNADYIPSEYPIVLEICGANFSDEEQVVVEKTLKNYFELNLGDSQLEVRKNRWKEIILLAFTPIVAVLLFLYWKFVDDMALVEELLLIGLWFFIWEWADVVAFEHKDIHMKRNAAAQLASVRIIFSDKFEDYPLDQETKEEIIEEIIANE